MAYVPKLDILPAAQRELWPEMSATPRNFTLYGGTAIALATSVDLDKLPVLHYDQPGYVFKQTKPTFEENLTIPWEGTRLIEEAGGRLRAALALIGRRGTDAS